MDADPLFPPSVFTAMHIYLELASHTVCQVPSQFSLNTDARSGDTPVAGRRPRRPTTEIAAPCTIVPPQLILSSARPSSSMCAAWEGSRSPLDQSHTASRSSLHSPATSPSPLHRPPPQLRPHMYFRAHPMLPEETAGQSLWMTFIFC